MTGIPCPCCGRPTSHPGVALNERRSAQAAVADALTHLRAIPGNQVERLEAAARALDAARERLLRAERALEEEASP